jgi:L-aminopeptidase/D-esterase-like protein
MGNAQWEPGPRDAITDVRGIRVGHWTDRRAATGCTVVLCEASTFVAVDARGGAPGTRETDVLDGANIVRKAHAVVLSGGSAFGLAAAHGVMRWLAEHDIGFATTVAKVPIVSAAVLFDLALGKPGAYPGEHEGYLAAKRATGGAVREGSVGAGTGATVAKLLGTERALKGGVGSASIAGPRGLMVGALAVTNAVGAIFDPDTGAMIAGPRGDEPGAFVPLPQAMHDRTARMDALIENTTLVVVATNATLAHGQLQRIAYQGHDGMARAIVPAHTFGDGDVAFAVAMGQIEAREDDALTVGLMTVRAVERAIVKSVHAAESLAGVPSASAFRSPR